MIMHFLFKNKYYNFDFLDQVFFMGINYFKVYCRKNQQLHSCQQNIKINSNDILFSDILLY